MAKVKVSDLVDAFRMASDDFVQAIDRETGEVVIWTRDDAFSDDGPPDPRNDPERFVVLPGPHELRGWDVRRDFAEHLTGRARDQVRRSLHGRGAYRAFRDAVERLDLIDAWYAWEAGAHARLARAWLEEEEVPYEDDVASPPRARGPAMAPRLSLVTLGVRDLARSVAFYRDVLGLPQLESPPEVAFFELGTTWLSLFGREALAADAGVPAEGSGFSGVTLAHNVADAAAVDALIAHVAAHGARIVKAPGRADWGGYTAYFADPDGHLWEVAYNPDFPHV